MKNLRIARLSRSRLNDLRNTNNLEETIVDALIFAGFVFKGTREEAISRATVNFDNVVYVLKEPAEAYADPVSGIIEFRQWENGIATADDAGPE